MTDETLSDGFGPDVPPGDTLLRDYVDSSVRYLVDVGDAVGAPTVEDDAVGGAHHGAPFPFANLSYARRPLDAAEWTDAIARLRVAYPVGVPFVIVSPFPTPDLTPLGFTRIGHPPFMVRPAGPAAVPEPDGVTIERVTRPEDLAEFEATLIEAYPGGPGGTFFTPGLLDVDGVALWIARLDGAPVATAAGHHGGAVNGVEIVSTRPAVRGRRVGEAITWAPTLVRPDRPAALFASDLGRSVYERMGFVAVLRFTLWVGA